MDEAGDSETERLAVAAVEPPIRMRWANDSQRYLARAAFGPVERMPRAPHERIGSENEVIAGGSIRR